MRRIDLGELLQKYFWIVPAIVIIICATFSAKAVNYYVSGKVLGPSDKPPKVPRTANAKGPAKTKATKSKDSGPLAKRNMFCHECEPVEPVASDAPAPADGSVPATSLPLELVATNVGSKPDYSFATIRNTSSNKAGAYELGQQIPDAGEVTAIRGKYVDFRNKSNRRLERINLMAKKAPKAKPKPVAAKGASKTRGARAELMSLVDESVNKVDDSTYEIDRKLVDKITSNPALVARGARVVPSIKNGKTVGFKLYAIRPSSVFAKIGLMNGDTLHSINNFELTSLDKGLEIYTKVREASNLSVNVTRRGKQMTLKYRIK
ncbi:MAG: hypothetical protein KJO07_04640 [Deltaproteobacteria bacterium]|nr:hypothetical protein [Deltaproteobacteria bacterium]